MEGEDQEDLLAGEGFFGELVGSVLYDQALADKQYVRQDNKKDPQNEAPFVLDKIFIEVL